MPTSPSKLVFDARNRAIWETRDPYAVPTLKRCCRCKLEKARKQFARARTNKEGLQAWCNACRQQQNLADPRKQMVVNARRRARERNLEFNLVIEDFEIPDICPVLNIPLKVQTKQSVNSPSLDRIDSTKGYVKGNVEVISWRANDIKSNATILELEQILKYMKEHT